MGIRMMLGAEAIAAAHSAKKDPVSKWLIDRGWVKHSEKDQQRVRYFNTYVYKWGGLLAILFGIYIAARALW